MRLSNHALARWRERHPHLDLHEELAAAKRPSKRLRSLLEFPTHAVPERIRQARRYLVTSNDVVFVLNEENLVLTVLCLGEAKRRARSMKRRGQEEAYTNVRL